MTKPRGPRSMPAPTGRSEARWLASGLVAVGVASSLGLILVSALLNFRMGYRSADTEFDGWIYGIGAGLADALKALAPFMAAYGLKNRDWLAAGAASVLFLVFTAYSFTAAMGFAAEHRSAKAAQYKVAIEARTDLRSDLKRQDEELSRIGGQRPSAEIRADISALLQRPIGPRARTVSQISAGCTLNRAATRSTCADLPVLQAELARAEQREHTVSAIDKLRKELASGGGEGARMAPDAQVDAIQRFASAIRRNLTESEIGFLLSLLMALLVELGSGLGLYVSTTPWRQSEKHHQDGRALEFGSVETFMLEKLESRKGAELSLAEVYRAYQQWCIARGQIAERRTNFGRRFGALAEQAGIRARIRNRSPVYQWVALDAP